MLLETIGMATLTIIDCIAYLYGTHHAELQEYLTQIPPTAAVYQRQLSVPSLRGRLMRTSESWGVNGHTTRYIGPVSVV